MRKLTLALVTVLVGGVVVGGAALPSHAATTTIPLAGTPSSVAVTPDGSTALVLLQGSVAFLDTATDQITRTVSVPGGSISIDIDARGTTAIVPQNGGFAVSLITIATGAVRNVFVGAYPNGATFDPTNSNIAYTANYGGGNVSALDITTGSVLATIATGQNPFAVAFTPDAGRAYVSNTGSGTVTVINTATRTPAATIVVGSAPLDIAVGPDGTEAYVANSASNSISVIDTTTNTVTTTIPVGTQPVGLAVSPDGDTLYVAEAGGSEVGVVNTISKARTGTIPVGSGPNAVAFMKDGGSAYVTNGREDTLSRIDGRITPVFTEDTPPEDATVGVDYAYAFAATGLPAPTFAVTAGVLPAGLTLSSSGLLSGTPTETGTTAFTVTASNGVGQDADSRSNTIAVVPAPVPPTFTNATPPASTVGSAYAYSFTATGDPVLAFRITSGALPVGLSLASDGTLTGTPTTSGASTFQVTASNGAGSATTAPLTVTITPAPVLPLSAPTITSPENGDSVASPVTYTGTGTPGEFIALITYPTDTPPQSSQPVEDAFADPDPIQVGSDGLWAVTRTVADPGETTSVAIAFLRDSDGTVTNTSAPSAPVAYTVTAASVTPPSGLASTGTNGSGLAVVSALAVLLIGAGITAVTQTRRRRKTIQ